MTRLRYALPGPAPLVIVVAGETDAEILAAYAASGILPAYFDANFDSLEACLHDLIDVERHNLVIVHGNPLDRTDPRVAIYLDILDDLESHPRLVQILRA